MRAENLKKLSREELVDLAITQGLPKPHHKAKLETIIKNILDVAEHPPKPEIKADKEKPVPVFLTEEEVERLVAPLKAKVPEFKTDYDHESRCVTFSCKGAENCMNLSTAATTMMRYAGYVSAGKRAPRALAVDRTATGNNAYTNAILA